MSSGLVLHHYEAAPVGDVHEARDKPRRESAYGLAASLAGRVEAKLGPAVRIILRPCAKPVGIGHPRQAARSVRRGVRNSWAKFESHKMRGRRFMRHLRVRKPEAG